MNNVDTLMDRIIGAHAFFSQWTVDTDNQGIIENFNDYPNYCKMLMNTTTQNLDLFNSEHIVEMKCQTDEFMSSLLKSPVLMNVANGNVPIAGQEVTIDFVIKPNICLNRTSGVDGVSYKKTGAIKLSTILSPNDRVFYGVGVQPGTTSYELSNIRLLFNTYDDDGSNSPMNMRIKTSIKQSISTNLANIATTVPLQAVDSFNCSFLKQATSSNPHLNNYQNEELPNVNRIEYLYNDSEDMFVNYPIEDRTEILNFYIKSFVNTGNNRCTLANLQANKGYGMGYRFDSPINFTRNKFSLQIDSGVSNTQPYVAHMYFSGMIQV